MVVVPTEEELPGRILIDSTRPIVGVAGATIAAGIAGRVTSLEGETKPLAGVSLSTPGDVVFTPPVLVTDFTSRFQGDVMLGCTPGSGVITASLNAPGGIMKTIPYTTMIGAPASIEKTQGDLQTGISGQLLNGSGQGLIAELKDACGNPIVEEPVEWMVSPVGGVTFENVFADTNGAGQMFAVVRLGEHIGPVMVTATTGGLSTTFTLIVTGVANQMTIAGGNNQLIPIGRPATLPLVIALSDLDGTPVAGEDVDFTVTQGSLELSAASAPTNAQGRASVSIVGASALGVATVEARSGALVVVFSLEVIGRTPVVSSVGFVNAASFLVGFVPGGTGSIFGVGLMEGIDGIVPADTFPFPLELRGVKVFVDGVQSPIISISNINGTEQINIQVAFEVRAPADDTIVTIDNNGALTSFANVQTFRVQPGFFQIPDGNRLIVAALHLDFRLVSNEA